TRDVLRPCVRRDHDQRHAESVFVRIDDLRRNMIVPAAPIVPGDKNRGIRPVRTVADGIDDRCHPGRPRAVRADRVVRLQAVGCSKHGYWVVSVPLGSITVTVCVGGAMQPVLSLLGLTGLFSTNRLLLGLGADVAEIRNWWAGKLGPWLVWNIRSPKVYCSAIAKYGWTSAGFTYL